MTHFSYTPTGVCCQNIQFDIENNKVYNLSFHGGCAGNLCAISKLVNGEDAEKIISILKGNDCRGKGTSCADQLAKALEEALKK